MPRKDREKTLLLTTHGQERKHPPNGKTLDPRKRRFSIEGAGGLNSITLWQNHDPLNIHRSTTMGAKGGTLPGQKRGIRLKTYLRYMADGRREANRIYRYMTDKKIFVPDNNVSEEAMKGVLEVLRTPATVK